MAACYIMNIVSQWLSFYKLAVTKYINVLYHCICVLGHCNGRVILIYVRLDTSWLIVWQMYNFVTILTLFYFTLVNSEKLSHVVIHLIYVRCNFKVKLCKLQLCSISQWWCFMRFCYFEFKVLIFQWIVTER